ncbi:MAG: hypothetical protein DHS20C13_27280 [Thermodesulfobacteriota bacterium]|nr:MAG: hypothetical protein DHS20C13_27280 [Thermodesulfobacteriota bacterium]
MTSTLRKMSHVAENENDQPLEVMREKDQGHRDTHHVITPEVGHMKEVDMIRTKHMTGVGHMIEIKHRVHMIKIGHLIGVDLVTDRNPTMEINVIMEPIIITGTEVTVDHVMGLTGVETTAEISIIIMTDIEALAVTVKVVGVGTKIVTDMVVKEDTVIIVETGNHSHEETVMMAIIEVVVGIINLEIIEM